MRSAAKWVCGIAVIAMMSFTATSANANLFVNPGFEDPITMDGAPFVGFWEAFTSGAPISANSAVMPRTGAQHLELSISDSANQFAGVFQDVTGLTPGQNVVFSGWHKLMAGLTGGSEIRIEWRNSGTDTEISRTPNLVPVVTGDYTEFVLPSVVPAGADTARAVYAIQSFGGVVDQQIFVDDMSFVPEPASLALLGLGALAILRRRGA